MKKNISIKDFIDAVDYRIGEGSEYLWECYGNSASMLDWVKNDLSGSAAIVYDTKDQTVYEMSVWDTKNEKVYRWIRPEFVKRHKREAKARDFKFGVAYDDVKYEEATPARLLNELKVLKGRKNAKIQ